MNASIIDSVFISLRLDSSDVIKGLQKIQASINVVLGMVDEFSIGLTEGLSKANDTVKELATATDKAKNAFKQVSEVGTSGLEELGDQADKTKDKINTLKLSAKNLGKKFGGSIKHFLTSVVSPLTGDLSVSSLAKNYFSGLETLDVLSEKTVLSISEQAEKQELLAKYTKEDLARYREAKKAFDELGEALQEAFRPVMKIVVPALTTFSSKLLSMIKYCKEHKAFIIPLFAGIATVLATALIPTLLSLIPTLKTLELTATRAFIAFMRPLLPLIAIVTLLALTFEDLWVFMKGGDSALEQLMNKFGASKETIENTRATVKKMFNLFQEFSPYIIAFFGTILARSAVFKTLTTAVTFTSKALRVASTAIRGVALAFRIMTVAIASNPMGAALVALIAIISACIFYWDDLKEAGVSAWTWITSTWSGASEWFGEIVGSIKAKFQVFKDFLKDLLPEWLKDLLGIDGGKGIDATLSEAKEKLISMVDGLVPEGIAETLSTAGDALKSFGSDVADLFSFSTPVYAVSPSSLHAATANNTEVTTNMGGVTIEVKSTDPIQAGNEVRNGLEALVNRSNLGVKQK